MSEPRLAGMVAAVLVASLAAASSAPAQLRFDVDTTARWARVLREWSDETKHRWTNDSLRAELVSLGRVDQQVREGLTAERVRDTAFVRRMNRADSAHTARLKAIVRAHGWPGRSLVGAKGASAAWLILQHSPDSAFKEEGLRLILAAKPGEVSPPDVATLLDRVLVAQGKRQRYGTQFKISPDGSAVLEPLEDERDLDARRAEAGLMPMADQLRLIEQMYQVRFRPGAR